MINHMVIWERVKIPVISVSESKRQQKQNTWPIRDWTHTQTVISLSKPFEVTFTDDFFTRLLVNLQFAQQFAVSQHTKYKNK